MSKRILIVEDTPVTLAMAKQKLSAQGFIVNAATNGLEGMEQVKKYDFDLIVTDVVMPKMDGVDFYKELKKNPATRNIPILIITDNAVFKQAFGSLGVEGFIPKPVGAETLLSLVNKILSNETDAVAIHKKQILIAGTNDLKITQMVSLLEVKGQKVWRLDNSTDLLTKALHLYPDIVFLDVALKDVPAPETIKALRCFSRLKNLKICLFSCASPNMEIYQNVDNFDRLEDAVKPCMDAGADIYLGRFERAAFNEKVRKILQNLS